MKTSILSRTIATTALILLCSFINNINAQTLWVPSGTAGIASSSSSNVGINTSNPLSAFVVRSSTASNADGLSMHPVSGLNTIGFNRNAATGTIFNSSIPAWQLTSSSTYFRLESYSSSGLMTGVPLTILSNGNIGVSTTPQDLFHVHATNYLNGIYLDMQNGSNNGFVKFYPPNINYGSYNPIVASVGKDAGIIFGDNVLGANNGVAGFVIAPWRGNKSGFRMDQYGNVGIGTSLTSNPNGYMLAVNGTIGAKAIQVEITSSAWSDYVFEPDYKLMSLSEVEKYVRKNKHLPEVPSAAEVEEKGIDVASMDNILLRKIEELTLHMIEMKKEVNSLKSENESMKKELTLVKNK